jgi:indole-3-glycerol phosphate synthase
MPVMPPEWREREEKRKAEEAMRNTQGITIRRRPPTGPPLHNVGPFQFKIQSEGNTPRNILEEIVWHKDCEIAQVLLPKPSQQSLGLDSKNWQLEILMVQYAASFD